MSGDEDFLSRWSSRKRAVAKEDAASEPSAEAIDEAEPDSSKSEETEESEEDILARFNLSSPESLGPGDDFSGFMQSGVPEFLRRRALRRLWRSNPILANLDGLNDYDEDFTSPEETMKVLKTAYQVGRGFLRDDQDKPDDTKDGRVEPPAEAEVLATETPVEKTDDSDQKTTPAVEASKDGIDPGVGTAEEPFKATEKSPENAGKSGPRRMRFET